MLKLESVYKKYKQTVLSDVGFYCNKGEIVCIAGANGSGKSTLISVLCGITKPTSGRVFNDAAIGYAPQDFGLLETASVKDNIDFWAAAKKCAPRYEAFEAADLKKKAGKLSGGMKRRLSLCVALLGEHDFLVLDEPTASLDVYDQHYVMEIIKNSGKSGKGVIYTSHNASEISISDRLYILDKGHVVYEGETSAAGSMEGIADLVNSHMKINKGPLP